MKKISQLSDDHIPDKDGQFNFRERASKLVNQWQQILNSRASETDGVGVNGTAEKGDSAEGDAAAAETAAAATTTADGDVSMMTDA